MSSKASEVLEIIQSEAARARTVQDAFNRALCLFETHCTGRPSALLEMYPELRGQSLSETQATALNEALFRFIEDMPNHDCLPAAIKLLALTREKRLRTFFTDQLRRHLAWRNSFVVFELLLALEELGEKVFVDAEGRPLRSLSSNAFDVNLDAARRYLQKYDQRS